MGAPTRRDGEGVAGIMLAGCCVIGIALLGTLGAILAHWLPWIALLVAWPGGNAAALILARIVAADRRDAGPVLLSSGSPARRAGAVARTSRPITSR